jgi:hypothetical protein
VHAEVVGDERFLAGDAGPQAKAGPAVGNDVGQLRRHLWLHSGGAQSQLGHAGQYRQHGHHGESQPQQPADDPAHARWGRRSVGQGNE